MSKLKQAFQQGFQKEAKKFDLSMTNSPRDLRQALLNANVVPKSQRSTGQKIERGLGALGGSALMGGPVYIGSSVAGMPRKAQGLLTGIGLFGGGVLGHSITSTSQGIRNMKGQIRGLPEEKREEVLNYFET